MHPAAAASYINSHCRAWGFTPHFAPHTHTARRTWRLASQMGLSDAGTPPAWRERVRGGPGKNLSEASYRMSVGLLTFVCYALFHCNRKVRLSPHTRVGSPTRQLPLHIAHLCTPPAGLSTIGTPKPKHPQVPPWAWGAWGAWVLHPASQALG